MHVRERLPHGAQAPSVAREVVDALLDARLGAESLSEVRLVVSELVTNAVRHGKPHEGVVELFVTLGGGIARVEVTDGGDGFEPPRGAPPLEEMGGWGLIVVDRLASRWGIDGGPRTRVWAELPLDTFGPGGGATTAPAYARNV